MKIEAGQNLLISRILQGSSAKRSQANRPPKAEVGTVVHDIDQGPQMAQVPTSPDARLQRKRASRACDQCRRRKSRCDGQMNCSACQTIGLQCSFGHQVKQTRGPAYVAHLEKRVADLEGQLRRASRTSDTSIAEDTSTTQTSRTNSLAGQSPIEVKPPPLLSNSNCMRPSGSVESTRDSLVSNIIQHRNNGHHLLTVDLQDRLPAFVETITTEPRGKSFGLDMLRQLCNFTNHFLQRADAPSSSIKLVEALNSSQSLNNSDRQSSNPYLPQKSETCRLLSIAISEAFHLWPFVDRKQIDATIYRLYNNTNHFGREPGDCDDLGLIYALLALGQRFDKTPTVGSNEDRRRHGIPYFNAARTIVPLTSCDRSLTALQTVLCMTLYLKSASDQALAHAYITDALSAALRMGLHEQTPFFAQDESALRQRIWSTIRVLNTYISASLGLPDIVPLSSDCEHDAFPPLTSGHNAELAAANAHAELAFILNNAIDSIYRGPDARRPIGFEPYSVSYIALEKAHDSLEAWSRTCPVLTQSVENMTWTQLFLEYTYCYALLILYSPFVHHIAMPNTNASDHGYTYAKICFEAALHAIRVAEPLHKQMHFNGAYFFTVDVLAFATLVLLIVEVGCTDSQLVISAMRAGRVAKELLLVLSLHSPAAAECWSALSICDRNVRSPTVHDFSLSVPPPPPPSTTKNFLPINVKLDGISTSSSPKRPLLSMHFDRAIDLAMTTTTTTTTDGAGMRGGLVTTTANSMDPTLSMSGLLATGFDHHPGMSAAG